MFSAGSGGAGGPVVGPGGAPSNFGAMIGKATYEKYAGGINKSTVLGAGAFTGGAGGVGGGLFNKGDGSGTDRSTYHYPAMQHYQLNTASKEDKNFTSPGGPVTHGAVSALNLAGAGLAGGQGGHLDASYLMKNILSTPSSTKSKSGISQEDALDLQKQ